IERSGVAVEGGGGAGLTSMRAPSRTLAEARDRSPSTSTRPSSIHRCTVARDSTLPAFAMSVTTSLSSRSRRSSPVASNDKRSLIIGVGFVLVFAAPELRVRCDVRLEVVEALRFGEAREAGLIGEVQVERRVAHVHAHIRVLVLEAEDGELAVATRFAE